MRKNATYWGLGLAVAVGISATAASGWAPITNFGASIQALAEGDDSGTIENEEYRVPTEFTPATDSEVRTSQKLSQVKVTFKRAIYNINRGVSGKIVIKKDGQTVQTIDPTDTEAVYLDKTSQYHAVIAFNPWTAPGKYTIEFPEGLFTVGDIGDATTYDSVAFTAEYVVIQDFSYSVSPALGTQLPQINKNQEFVITFDGVQKIEIDDEIAYAPETGAQFCCYNKSVTKATDVDLEVKGNQIIVTALDGFFVNCSNPANIYIYLYLPKGALKMTDTTGKTVDSPRYIIGNYYTVAVPSNNLEVLPGGAVKEQYSPADFKEVTVKINGLEGVERGSVGTSATGVAAKLLQYNPETGVVSTANQATYTCEATDDPTVFKFKMKAATAPGVVLNNPELWEKGNYCFQIQANCFKRTETITNKSVNGLLTNFMPYYIDGLSTVVARIQPEDDIINPADGLSSVIMLFESAVEPMDKPIRIYKKGETTALYEFSSSDTKYVTLYNSNKSLEIKFPAIKNITGDIVVEIPEGAFRQTGGSNLLSAAVQKIYNFPETAPVQVVPASGSNFTPQNPFQTVKLVYDGASKVTVNVPEGEEKAQFQLKSGAAFETSSNVSNVFVVATVNEEAPNTVDLTLTKVYNTQSATQYWIGVPAGLITVEKDGKKYNNPPMHLTYRVQKNEVCSFSPASGSTITINELGEIKVTPPAGLSISGFGTGSSAWAKLFGAPDNPGAFLSTGAANTFLQFVPKTETRVVTDEEGNETTVTELVKDENGAVTLVPNGQYNIAVIPSGNYVLRMSNSNTESSSFLNFKTEDGTLSNYNVPFNLDYTINNNIKIADLTLAGMGNRIEVLPEDGFVVQGPEGSTLSSFDGFEKKWGVTIEGNTSTAYDLVPEFKDGKLYLTWAEGAFDKLSKAKYQGKRLNIFTYAGTTKGAVVLNGAVKVTMADGSVETNGSQNLSVLVTGPVSDPVYTLTPAAGIVKPSDYPEGVNVINIATDPDIKLMPDFDKASTLSGVITKDGVRFATFNAYDTEVKADNIVDLTLSTPMKEEGLYKIIFPRGFFKLGTLDTPSSEFTITYTVEAVQNIDIASTVPAQNDVVNSFTGITLNFQNIEIASAEARGITYSVQNPAVSPFGNVGLELEAVVNPDKHSVLLTFSEADEAALKQAGKWPVTDPGYYTINIDPNHIIITDVNGVKYGNSFLSTRFEVVPETAIDYTPADGTYFPELSEMTLTFKDIKTIEAVDFATEKVTLTKGETDYPVTTVIKDNVITVSTAKPIAEVGKYTLKVPAHLYNLTPANTADAAYQNGPISHVFTIQSAPKLNRVVPANGSKVDFLTNVDFFFSAPVSSNTACKEEATLKNANGDVLYSIRNRSCKYPGAEDDPNYVGIQFSTDKNAIAPGTYTLEVPAAYWKISGVPTEAMTLTYTVIEPTEWSIEPKNNSMVENIKDIVLSFPGATNIVNNGLKPDDDGYGGVQIYSTGRDALFDPVVTIDGSKVIFTLDAENLPEGQTVVNLPQGAFTLTYGDEVVASPEILVQYNTPNIPIPTLTVNETDGQYLPNTFACNLVMTLPEGTTFDMWLPSNTGALYKVKPNGDLESGSLCQWAYNREDGSCRGKQSVTLYSNQTIEGDDAFKVEKGDYAIRFRKGTVMVQVDPYFIDETDPTTASTTKVCNTDLIYYYTVVESGSVSSLFGDDTTEFNIYTTDGKIVKVNATADDVNNLEPGMYVINGRVVYIQK